MNRAGVHLTEELAAEMVAHCVTGRPNEACGILGSRNGAVVKVFRMTNADASPVRYSLEPAEQFAVYKALEEEGCQLGGVFHSHTRTPAYPSPTDVRLATEDVPYVIVSLSSEPSEIRAFRIIKDNWMDSDGRVEEVPVTISG